MSNLSFFEFKSNRVRTVVIDGTPAFCLSDSLIAMNTKTTTYQAQQLISEYLGEGYITVIPLETIGGTQNILFVLEAGLTFLLSRSRTEAGKELNRLIHTEILPTIRKTGKCQIQNQKEAIEDSLDFVSKSFDIIFAGTAIKPELIAGLKLNAIQQIAPEKAKLIEPSRQLLINATAQEHRLLTPTEIGKELGISGQAVNKLLTDRGLQLKNVDRKSRKDSAYLPTDRGSEFSDLTLASGSGNDSTTYQQLRWYESVLNVLN